MEQAIRQILRDIGIDLAGIDEETDLIEAELFDSLGLISLIGAVEERYRLHLTDRDYDIDNFKSISAICALVKKYEQNDVAVSKESE